MSSSATIQLAAEPPPAQPTGFPTVAPTAAPTASPTTTTTTTTMATTTAAAPLPPAVPNVVDKSKDWQSALLLTGFVVALITPFILILVLAYKRRLKAKSVARKSAQQSMLNSRTQLLGEQQQTTAAADVAASGGALSDLAS
mmetsp:Transcript_49141/g.120494  ORF Transcript_49141/g.120494 Transcript_49141/m.120494 type:complete len:142 (-) Transcript_49141:120-545(-)